MDDASAEDRLETATVLDEDEYTARLEAIMRRDFPRLEVNA